MARVARGLEMERWRRERCSRGRREWGAPAILPAVLPALAPAILPAVLPAVGGVLEAVRAKVASEGCGAAGKEGEGPVLAAVLGCADSGQRVRQRSDSEGRGGQRGIRCGTAGNGVASGSAPTRKGSGASHSSKCSRKYNRSKSLLPLRCRRQPHPAPSVRADRFRQGPPLQRGPSALPAALR